MSEGKRMTVRRSAEEWRMIVSRFEHSSQTHNQCCTAEDLAPSTFSLWRRKLRGSVSEANGAGRFEELGDSPTVVWQINPSERQAGNHRNGTSRKTVDTGSDRLVLDIPRDRRGRFDPVLIGKYQRRFPGFDEKIVAMYARGMSTRDTTNAIESLHSQVRKAIRNKGHFPSDEAATKLIYLALRNITAKWKNPPREWHAAKAQFAIQFGDRFVLTI